MAGIPRCGVSGIVFTIIIILLFVSFRSICVKPISPTAPSQVRRHRMNCRQSKPHSQEPLLIHLPGLRDKISRLRPSCHKMRASNRRPTTNPRTTSPTDRPTRRSSFFSPFVNLTLGQEPPVRFISYRLILPWFRSRLGGLVSGIHTVFHRHIQKPAKLSDYGLYHFNNRPDYFSCTGRNLAGIASILL